MKGVTIRSLTLCWLFCLLLNTGLSQNPTPYNRCVTMDLLEASFKKDPLLQARFEKNNLLLQQVMQQPSSLRLNGTIIEIPVVFHIVLTNQSLVTNAQIQAQLDTLNKDFAGLNGDSVLIPAAFKPLFGKSSIRFVMARRTPDNEPTDGIVRKISGKSIFNPNDTSLKYNALGGADAWDPNLYFNVWVTNISGGILGYGTFPQTTYIGQQGVAILYSTLPGGIAAPYDKGRTLTHEAGHFFSLYHIWGDENGCTGSDQISETPNQAGPTYGCPGPGVKVDACSPTAPGVMYQNFMDYTDDACMHMFTNQQVDRMLTALNLYRPSLITSDGGVPVVLKNLDAAVTAIISPEQRVCDPVISPVITFRNRGMQTITSASFFVMVDNGAPVLTQWTANIASLVSTQVILNNITITEGRHTVKIYVANPNGGTDDDHSNDTLTTTVQYYAPVEPPLTESFESTVFPPPAWDIVNPDRGYTWERVTGIAKTGNASVLIRNLEYQQNGPKDDLRLPEINLLAADSAFMTFQVAAAVQTDPATPDNVWDTLEVLVSQDCGKTYFSLYKKWGANLITRSTPVTSPFIPAATEWRKDSVNITPYINRGPFMLAFRNTTQYENNIYLDDINVYKKIVNPILKERGVLVTPNPTQGQVVVQFYPNANDLRGIIIFNAAGSRVLQQNVPERGLNYYSFDLSRFAAGMYYVRIIFREGTRTYKILKTN